MRVESISIFDEAKLQKAQKAAGVSFSSIFATPYGHSRVWNSRQRVISRGVYRDAGRAERKERPPP